MKRENDYIGRMLAEASVSDWTVALTLTYAPKRKCPPDDLSHKVINKFHAQAFVRALRKRGHSIRYFIAGEYGTLRDRAHFHVLVFGMGERPQWVLKGDAAKLQYGWEAAANRKERKLRGRADWPDKTNFHSDVWPHGHMYADWDTSHRAFRYACKYLYPEDTTKETWFSLSKKPPLGHEFFMQLAERNIALGVLPSGFGYVPPNGKPGQTYMMSGRTRANYLLRVIEGYQEKYPLEKTRLNEWVAEVIDKIILERMARQAEHPETGEFMKALKAEVDKTRPSVNDVKNALRSSNFYEYLFTPTYEVDPDGT